MIACFLSIGLHAQNSYQVTGIIIGTNNKGVADISVSVRGESTQPVYTDSLGNFEISVPHKNATLLISPSFDYKPQVYFLSGKTSIKIKLTPIEYFGNQDEVNNFFGFSKKMNTVSANSQLDLNKQTYLNQLTIDNQINGSVPGVLGIKQSGSPESGSTLFLRGYQTLNANTQPLYIIDGLPLESQGIVESFVDGYNFNPLSSINPSDITNITIIKDNSGSPVYGVRAANGIVLIETLKPNQVETLIDFSYKTGKTSSPRISPQLKSTQYRTLAKEILMTAPLYEEDHPIVYPGLFKSSNDVNYFEYNNETNWQEVIFRDAIMNDLYFRILGGDEIAKYGLSIGFQKNEGVIKSSDFERFSVRFVGSFDMLKWLNLSINSNLSSTNSSLMESARVSQTSPVYTALLKNPLQSPYQYDKVGNLLKTNTNYVDELGISNPYAIIAGKDNSGFFANNKGYRFLTSFRIKGDITDNLKINSNLGVNFNSLTEKMFMPNLGMELYYDNEAWNVSKAYSNYFYSLTNDNYLSYTTSLNDFHKINVNLGFRTNTNKYQADWGIGKNSDESDQYTQLNDGDAILNELGGTNANWNSLAIYSNLAYSFLDKYFLNFDITTEHSTRVGENAEDLFFIKNVPYGLFYGVGFAWRISEEAILKDEYWLDDLKLRFSYGKSGNEAIDNVSAYNYYKVTHYRNATGLIPGPRVDETFTYEDVYKMNTGVDFTTWGNRLNLTIDYYNNRTENLVIYNNMPFYYGFEKAHENDGTVLNSGLELDLLSHLVEKKKFSFSFGANISTNNNKISQLKETIYSSFLGGEFISKENEKLINFFGLNYEGVFSSESEAETANLYNDKGLKFEAGDAKFEDLSGPDGIPDHVIDDYDKQIIGSPIPDFFGGINMHFRYDNWQLNIGIYGVYGNKAYNYVRNINESMTGIHNQSTAVLNRWQYEEQETDVPRAVWNDPLGNADFSSRWIEDASYLRLKDLTLSYHLPSKFLSIKNAEFFVSGINLLTFSKYLGYDPEFAFSYKTTEQGIDYGLAPQSRTVLVGVKLGL